MATIIRLEGKMGILPLDIYRVPASIIHFVARFHSQGLNPSSGVVDKLQISTDHGQNDVIIVKLCSPAFPRDQTVFVRAFEYQLDAAEFRRSFAKQSREPPEKVYNIVKLISRASSLPSLGNLFEFGVIEAIKLNGHSVVR